METKIINNPICCFSVLASEPQQESPVPGILGISDVTIVTEDSFSMVCEAASSGKKIVVLEVERKNQGHGKRQRVYELLVQRGYVRKANVSSLKSVVLDFVGDTSKPKALDDAQTAADALSRLIF
jgi:mitochondrial fission protein ELM1